MANQAAGPAVGSFVDVRGRPWLVVGNEAKARLGTLVSMVCVADDAQGETLNVLWESELAARALETGGWQSVAQSSRNDPAAFGAYLRTIRWNTATAADRQLLQAPFRAGIRLDAYQLAPLRKALLLPRANLLIADDTGVGKTIEAGLVLRELLLRRRAQFIVVAAPASMTLQWQDELEDKFGLSFTLIDRDFFAATRRQRGFNANPWMTGSGFIISHSLLIDETYVAGLREALGEFRPRAVLVLDEAHHAAPSSGARYAIDSQFTKAIRDLAGRFEHRLFLSATPHNGHSNSFSALLEMLDPQRFTRGVPARAKDLEQIMVRRLKSDLRRIDERAFPLRLVEPIKIDGLEADTPELLLAEMLSGYRALRETRISKMGARKAAQARIVFAGLQHRLLSSAAAFASTLAKHKQTLERQVADSHAATREHFRATTEGEDAAEFLLAEDEAGADELIASDDRALEAATVASAPDTKEALARELATVEEMLAVAVEASRGSDARVSWILNWINSEFAPGGTWNNRRLLIFTEWETTRRWLERRLKEGIAKTADAENRIEVFSGATGIERREDIKRRFNADPEIEPLRILICTDAAREGLNFQTACSDLLHFDLPWNPARLEQRNGRIDRKLQPAPEVHCRYFVYAQRPEDIVLQALVRKSDVIRTQLGSMGQVLETRIKDRLESAGIDRAHAKALADEIDKADDPERLETVREEMDDQAEARYARVVREIEDLRRVLERSQERVGVEPAELQCVVEIAFDRAGAPLNHRGAQSVGAVRAFPIESDNPVFTHDPSWLDALDELRTRRRARRERLSQWRRAAPLRSISFAPPVLADGRDATDVVQVHLEHRLVRRLLSRFLSQGFQSDLDRVCAIVGDGAQPRVILLARLMLFGVQGQRLHEEIIPVTAVWTESDRQTKPLRPLGAQGEETTLDQLESAIKQSRAAADSVVRRLQAFVERDIVDLTPELEARAEAALANATRELKAAGDRERKSLADLLVAQRDRIRAAEQKAVEADLPLLARMQPDERRQREADRRHWSQRLLRIEEELEHEPESVRRSYDVAAHRLEPVGVVYLWPATG